MSVIKRRSQSATTASALTCLAATVAADSEGASGGRPPALILGAVTSGLDARALRVARERSGLTQSDLARKIGVVGGERVSRWELGRSQPRPDLLVRMAQELGIRPRQLVSTAGSVPDLRALRLAAGLDAYEVANAVHLSLPTYRKWEQGRWGQLPPAATVTALAKTLRSSPAEVERAFRSARQENQQCESDDAVGEV